MTEGQPQGRRPARAFFLSLVVVVSFAFLWLVTPFAGAILWAVIGAVLFDPLHTRLLRAMPRRRNGAALLTLLVIIAVVVIPAILLGAALLSEATVFFARISRGEIDLAQVFVDAQRHLPGWARGGLADVGLSDAGGLRTKLAHGLTSSFQSIATRMLNIGQGALGFFLALGVTLYLTFFLLRDGRQLTARIEQALPLPPHQRTILVGKIVMVIRATIKGSAIVAVLQGVVGGCIFWALGLPGASLWGVAMGFFSLFPAIGTGLVWVPVALYLLASGAIWKGITLLLCGFCVISTVDNIVRPILVGRDARMPDYVVLITTLGGFELMGFNGFVIGPLIAALFLAVWEIFIRAADGEEGELPASVK